MKRYEVGIGCKEWQEVDSFDICEAAEEFIGDKNNWICGLHSASYGYVLDTNTNTKIINCEEPPLLWN